MTKVSIIVPVYNTSKYLEECLDSLVNQTYDRDLLDIVCVDDGSTDNSLEILKQYKSKYSCIKVIHQENGGLSSARNTGLSNSIGDVVTFIDSDDYLSSDTIEKAVKAKEEYDVDLVVYGMQAYADSEISQDLKVMNDYVKLKYSGKQNLTLQIANNTNIHVCNKLFDMSIINKKNLRFARDLLYEDISFMWFYYLMSKTAYYLPDICYNYRIHAGSIMESSSKSKKLYKAIDHLKNWQTLVRWVRSRDTNIFARSYNDFVFLLEKYIRNTRRMSPEEDSGKIDIYAKYYKDWLDSLYERDLHLDNTRSLDFSVIVPVYNVEAYLEQCLDSIRNQDINKDTFEIICIDDGSTDSSGLLLDKYQEEHPELQMKVIHQKNGGLAAARNTGLRVAKGNYICFVDSDDTIQPETLKECLDALRHTDAPVLVFGAKAFNDGAIYQKESDFDNWLIPKYSGMHHLTFEKMRRTAQCVWNKIYSRRFLELNNIQFNEGLLYEDISFTWSIYLEDIDFYYLPKCFYYYRLRQGSIMEESLKEKSFDSVKDHLINVECVIDRFVNDKQRVIEYFPILEYLINRYANDARQMLHDEQSLAALQDLQNSLLDRVFSLLSLYVNEEEKNIVIR